MITRYMLIIAGVLTVSSCGPLAPSQPKIQPNPCDANNQLNADMANVHVGDSDSTVNSKLNYSYTTINNQYTRKYDNTNGQAGCQHWIVEFDSSNLVTQGFPQQQNN